MLCKVHNSQQRTAQFLLQLPDLLRKRRLRDVQPRRRMPEVQFLRHRHEIPQVA